MNPLALNLNEQLNEQNPNLLDMMSDLGKNMYYPKGILTQSAEAKSADYNATIGMATNRDGMMYADALYDVFNHLSPEDVFAYAAPQGLEALRDLWLNKVLSDNPDLKADQVTRPIVTNALTHGLSLVGDMFVNPGDTVLLPAHTWGNYNLVYGVRHQAEIQKYPIFDENGHYTTQGLVDTLNEVKQDKIVLILNYPNNPTGYTPTADEVRTIVEVIDALAKRGVNVVTVVDDAYFGLFYEDVYKQSIFTALTNVNNPRILPIRLDGATKEFFAWGFRVGFITFGLSDATSQQVVEAKVKGLIRSNNSNGSTPSQSAVRYVLENPEQFNKDIQANIETLEARYQVTKELVYKEDYQALWQPYDFNSGYFMALRVKDVNAETLRKHLIEQYSIGIVALNDTDIRIAFSCIEKDDIPHVFEKIAQGIQDLQN